MLLSELALKSLHVSWIQSGAGMLISFYKCHSKRRAIRSWPRRIRLSILKYIWVQSWVVELSRRDKLTNVKFRSSFNSIKGDFRCKMVWGNPSPETFVIALILWCCRCKTPLYISCNVAYVHLMWLPLCITPTPCESSYQALTTTDMLTC